MELEEEWKGKCEKMLAAAKEERSRELAEVTEQRDALQEKMTQLEEKVHTQTHTQVCASLIRVCQTGTRQP